MSNPSTAPQLHNLELASNQANSLVGRLMIMQLQVSMDRQTITADHMGQAILGMSEDQPLATWLEGLEPTEIHSLIGKVDIDSTPILVRDLAGIYTPAKLWQYRSSSQANWQIAIQIEMQNATDENPLKKRFFAQQQLLSIISHELRTPAATLKMLIDELSEQSLAEQLPLMRDTSEHLMAVLQDMRQAINPQQNLPHQLRVFHPNRLLESVTSQVRRMAQAQGIALRMELISDEQLRVKSDLERCKLIMLNLLKNAVLHSDGTEVCVSAEVSGVTTDEPSMTLSIRDNGVGIAPAELDRILQPFERMQGLEQGGDGAGLGLFVVKQSISELGGTLTLSPIASGGLEARAVVPITPVQSESSNLGDASQESKRFQKRLATMRVLVVEDDPVIRMVSQKLLAKRVGQVDVAENGAAGLEKIKSSSYDLILSDFFMPVMDGAEMIRQARACGILTPIISVTAAVLGEEAQELRDAGANQVLAKPISMKAFIDAVEQL